MAAVFLDPESTRKSIEEAGEKAMIMVYGGDSSEVNNLDLFWYKVFQWKVVTATIAVKPEDLPPTSAATKFQSWRTYLHVVFNDILLISYL